MRGYDIVAVIWEDHITKIAEEIPDNPDDDVSNPTVTVGILLRETDKSLLIAHDIEGYGTGSYSVILKGTVNSIKKFGEIKLKVR